MSAAEMTPADCVAALLRMFPCAISAADRFCPAVVAALAIKLPADAALFMAYTSAAVTNPAPIKVAVTVGLVSKPLSIVPNALKFPLATFAAAVVGLTLDKADQSVEAID